MANGLLYAFSGSLSNANLERYDTEANQWTMLCSLNETFRKVCTTFRDKIVVCYDDRFEEYNPSTNEWEVNMSLKGLADCCHIFSYSDKLFKSEFTEN